MTTSLVTFDYYEQLMLMLGWIINNKIWTVLFETNLAAVPFVALIIKEAFEAVREGDEVGNKGSLAANRTLASFAVMLIVFAVTCFPLYQISMKPISIDEARTKECGVKIIGSGKYTEAKTINSLGNTNARIPLFWAFIHIVYHAGTNAAVASIPCSVDYKSLKIEGDLQSIHDPVLKQNIGEFLISCYSPSHNELFAKSTGLKPTLGRDIDWIGSEYFLNTPGYYDTYTSRRPMPGFPFNAVRDEAMSNTGVGKNGYPTCKEWWSDPQAGIRARLVKEVDPDFWDSFKSVFTAADAEDHVIRRLIRVSSQSASGDLGMIVTGYRPIDGGTSMTGAISDVAVKAGAVAGGIWDLYPLHTKMEMVKVALPMVQYILMMVIIISLPIIIVVSGYSVKTVLTGAVTLFALQFMTFWWELARFLDSKLITMLYDSEAAQLNWWSVGNGKFEQLILQFVEAGMYIVIPAFWLGIITWVGISIGSSIGGTISKGVSSSENAGEKGGNKMQNLK